MILQELFRLYERLPDVERQGFSRGSVSWCILLDHEGKLIRITSLLQKSDSSKKIVPLNMSIPSVGKRTMGDKPNFMVDKIDYVFGLAYEEKDNAINLKLNRFDLFKALNKAAKESINHPDFDAVCLFLDQWNPSAPDASQKLAQAAGTDFKDLADGNYVFQVCGQESYVHELPDVKHYWQSHCQSEASDYEGLCLVTGKTAPVARLHPSIKGVRNAQTSGASIVSFNLSAFLSYGKDQGFNAPLSQTAAFAYCTALNHLLADRSRKFQIGDSTTVLWTDKPSPIESDFMYLIASSLEPEDSVVRDRVQGVLRKVEKGLLSGDDLGEVSTRYFVLGLSANASRLSIRFWLTGTLGDLAAQIQKHQRDIEIVKEHNNERFPSVYDFLKQTARDADSIPPLLGGALIRSLLLGTPYPEALIGAVIRRIKAGDKINYFKASILKGWLVRNHQTVISLMLDESALNIGYRLGRLFALLEKTQSDALPGVNASIRDRYYSSASGTPRAVFARLLRGYQHHIAKLGKGSQTYREKQIQEVLSGVTDFPANLNLADQAQFALGYYHQRKALYTAKDKAAPAESSQPDLLDTKSN